VDKKAKANLLRAAYIKKEQKKRDAWRESQMSKTARADVNPVRQRTQYTCMSTSMMMCLRANGHNCTEDEVNRVMGARPMKGAAWEHALACGQHYGMRCTLTTPSTVDQLKSWTDKGIPVMIAWNPEGRDWSHASVVFDVDNQGNVYVADPNIPDPRETVRIMPAGEFYGKWYEKWPDYLVRRPAMAVEREISEDGRQMMASASGSVVAEYQDALRQLEASVDTVALMANKLESMGIDPQGADYPFAEGIDAVASDIYRWRGAVEQQYTPQDMSRVASRVARRFLEKK